MKLSNKQNGNLLGQFLSIYYFTIYYLVWPPFAFKTASILLGMLSIRFWHTSGEIAFHSSLTLSHNSWTPLGGVSYWQRCHFRCSQRCLIGFRSGDWAGQDKTWISLSLIHFLTFLEVCFGSMSCWKYCSPSFISDVSKLSTSPSSKISQYCLTSIFSSTSINFSTPYHQVISSSMLYCWSCSPIRKLFSPLLPYICFPIWPNLI